MPAHPQLTPEQLPYFHQLEPVATSKLFGTSRSSVVHQAPSSILVAGWDDAVDAWHNLIGQEQLYQPNPAFLDNHPALKPPMRTKVIDWLMEV